MPAFIAPPPEADLDFVEYQPSGTVHVHEYIPPPWTRAAGLEHLSFGEGLMAMFTTPRRMLCGQRFLVGFPGAPGDWTDCFEDEAICGRCVKVLGGQSPRAFEHPQPGDEPC